MADNPDDYHPSGENSLEDDRAQRQHRTPSSYSHLHPSDHRPARGSGPGEPPGTANGNCCAHCGAELPVSVRFCGSCGAPRVEHGGQQTPPRLVQQPPQGYGPPPGGWQQPPQGDGQRTSSNLSGYAKAGLVVVVIVLLAFWHSRTSGSSSPPAAPSIYSGSELAANLKAGAIQQGYRPDLVQVTCSDAPRRAGATSTCKVVRNTITFVALVTFSDELGHFVVQTVG